jgi:hypothetical protein
METEAYRVKSDSRNQDLQCRWRSISALDGNAILIELPECNCVDMSGAIKVCEFLMPEVEIIYVEEGKVLDNVYVKKHGEWICVK